MINNDILAKKIKYAEIKITRICNNNCIFCINRGENFFNLTKKQIFKAIDEKKNIGQDEIMIDGGEATIHPDFIECVRYAKEKGFVKIRLLTNGRMLYYRSFVRRLILAGVNDVMISIHGHNSDLHDKHTRVKGSFRQILSGIKNVREISKSLNKNVSIDLHTVITGLNYKYLPEIFSFFENKFKLDAYDFLQIKPVGGAFENRKIVFYDIEKAMPYLKKIYQIAANNRDLRINFCDFQPVCFEDYEFLIDDISNIYQNIYAKEEVFLNFIKNGELSCYNKERCQYCQYFNFCRQLIKYRLLSKSLIVRENEFIELNNYNKFNDLCGQNKAYVRLDKDNLKYLNKDIVFIESDNLYFTLRTFEDIEDLKSRGVDLVDFFKIYQKDNMKFINLPFCLAGSKNRVYNYNFLPKNLISNKSKDLDLWEFVKFYVRDLYNLKSLRCRNCALNKKCKGLHYNFVKLYGFKILNPINIK